MKIQICYSPSGFGLANDAVILKETLEGLGYASCIRHVPSPKAYRRISKILIFLMRTFNVLYLYRSGLRIFKLIDNDSLVIHLENLNYLKLFDRKNHVLIPNQEWYDPTRLEFLKYLHSVWCKTRLADAVFSELGCDTQYIGFRAKIDESLVQNQANRSYFFSRTGISAHRGAETLVNTWAENPHWPRLKLLIHPSRRPKHQPKNVEYLDVLESQDSYNRLASGSLFHIYLAETEGFGHSIVEALGYGAVVIALDAPPMNELLCSKCALLVRSRYVGQKRLSPRFGADHESLKNTIDRALSLSDEEIVRLSDEAKRRYSTLANQFPQRLEQALLNVINRTH